MSNLKTTNWKPGFATIRAILLTDWDPIGIKDVPQAQDEYDSYVPMIYQKLIQQRPKHKIFDYL